MTRPSSLADLASIYDSQPISGMRNRIINGDMRIDQRNGGASVSAALAGTYFAVDRTLFFKNASSVQRFSVQQSTNAPVGFNNSLLVTTTLSSSWSSTAETTIVQQNIEGFNTASLGWGTAAAVAVTLSFFVRGSATGIYGVSLRNNALNRSYVAEYTINAANTWEFKTITIPGDTSGTWETGNLTGIRVSFDLGSSTNFIGTAGSWTSTDDTTTANQVIFGNIQNATWQITGIQLEAGAFATPFERRSFGQELALCQRYYQVYTQPPLRGVMAGGALAHRCGMVLPVVMRATPTASVGSLPVFDGSGVGAVTSVGVAYLNSNTVEFDFNTTNFSAQFRPAIIYQAGSASLALNAEL